jgi:hypothetical protein
MKRILFALPLAGAMMTAPLVYAQTPPPAPAEQPAQAAPTQQDEVQPERGDCVDLSGVAPSGDTDDMQAALSGEDADDANAAQNADAEESASQSTSETQPVAGPDAGTAPGGSGSTGFTGGLGGSNIGTSQSEELDSSPQQDHPQVASGLDPISGETAIEGPQAPAAEPDDDAATVTTAPDEDGQDATDC